MLLNLIVLGVAFAALLSSFALLALFFFQKWLLYYPQVPFNNLPTKPCKPADMGSRWRSPSYWGIDYEDLKIRTKDGEMLHAWLLKCDRFTASTPTLIFLHGNAGHIGLRNEFYNTLMRQTRCNILALEYRGFGHSTGSPSEEGLILDTKAAIEYCKSRKDIGKLVLFGRSLGGAVAIAVASEYHNDNEALAGVILENTFLSIEDVVHEILEEVENDVIRDLSRKMVKQMIRLKWRSFARIHRIKTPILFLSGRSDELIPPFHMDDLFELSTSELKYIEKFPTGEHNMTWTEAGYCESIQNFLFDI